MKTRIITIITALGIAAASPGIAQGAVPSRKVALKSATAALHDRDLMSSTLGYDAEGSPLVKDGLGLYWRTNTPKISRVRGGWDTCAIVIRGHDAAGNVLVRLGNIRVRGFRGGYSTTLNLLPAGI